MGYSKNEHQYGNTGKFLAASGWGPGWAMLGWAVPGRVSCLVIQRSPSLAIVLLFSRTQLARLPLLLSAASNSKSWSSMASTLTPLASVWVYSGTCGS